MPSAILHVHVCVVFEVDLDPDATEVCKREQDITAGGIFMSCLIFT